MIIVEKINKQILKIIIEVCFLFFFLFLSLCSWKNFDDSGIQYAVAFQANPVYSYISIENAINYAMFPMKSDEALEKLVPSNVKIINPSLTKENYSLFLKINSSSLNYQFLNISINDQIFSLKDLFNRYEKGDFYFLIASSSLTGEEKLYEVRLWLDFLTPKSINLGDLLLSFELEINK